MCEKCVDIDTKIKRYEHLVRAIGDQATIDGLTKLIAKLRAEKAALHPELKQ